MTSCPECGFPLLDYRLHGSGEALYGCVYDEALADQAGNEILAAAERMVVVIESMHGEAARQRSAPGRWSAIEYACHVRDVLLVQRERVLRSLRGFGDEALPMGREARVEHDGYREQDSDDVAIQLRHSAKMFVNVLDRLNDADWQLTVNYMFPDPSPHTLRWVAVHTTHELVHHLHDIETVE